MARIEGNQNANTLEGTDNDDRTFGFGDDDVLLGRGGDDLLDGGRGSDLLIGAGGDDVLVVGGFGTQEDEARGGAGSDTVDARDADGQVFFSLDENGRLSGGTTPDSADDIVAGDEIDPIFASGIENLAGGDFEDSLRGNDSANVLTGRGGIDELFGNGGADRIEGGGDNDFLFGGTGADVLLGGAGDDFLNGNDGDDDYTGGAGADEFVVSNTPGDHVVEIFDFDCENQDDELFLFGYSVTTRPQFVEEARDGRDIGEGPQNDTVLRSDGDTIILYDVSDEEVADCLFFTP